MALKPVLLKPGDRLPEAKCRESRGKYRNLQLDFPNIYVNSMRCKQLAASS